MSSINLMISVTRDQQIAIEEHCINAGINISAYLTGLHDQYVKSLTTSKLNYIDSPEKKSEEISKKKKPSK